MLEQIIIHVLVDNLECMATEMVNRICSYQNHGRVSLIGGMECGMEWWDGIWNGL